MTNDLSVWTLPAYRAALCKSRDLPVIANEYLYALDTVGCILQLSDNADDNRRAAVWIGRKIGTVRHEATVLTSSSPLDGARLCWVENWEFQTLLSADRKAVKFSYRGSPLWLTPDEEKAIAAGENEEEFSARLNANRFSSPLIVPEGSTYPQFWASGEFEGSS